MTPDSRFHIRPRSRWALCTAILILVFTAVGPAFAQDWKGRGRVRGKVVNAQGEPIENAKITILFRGQKGEGPDPVATDDEGRWAYMGLSSAPYTVIVEAEGYAPSEGEVRVNEYSPMGTRPVEVTLRELTAQETGSEGGDRLNQLLVEANALAQEGQNEEARKRYQEILAEVDNDKEKWQLERAIASTYIQGGQAAEGRALFEKLLPGATDPAEQVQMLQTIARTYYMEENIDQSVATLERALVIQPDDVASLRLIVDILVAAGREVDAEPYMARLPEGEKIDPNAMLNLGITAYNGGEIETALEKFLKVVADYPDNANAHYYLGLVYLNQQKNAEALAAFERETLLPDIARPQMPFHAFSGSNALQDPLASFRVQCR